jgi:5'-3' exonuclease
VRIDHEVLDYSWNNGFMPCFKFCQEEADNAEDLKLKLKTVLRDKADVLSGGGEVEDSVKLGEPGWRERYYQEKFQCKTPEEMEAVRRDVVCRPCLFFLVYIV